MKNEKVVQSLVLPGIIIVVAVLIRIFPHIPNVTPLAAMALFGGAYLDKRWAFGFPLIALFVSDMILGFHDTMFFVYVSFLLTGLIGYALRKHRQLQYILAGALTSSVLFYLITNVGVWLVGSMYPKTFSGLLEAYYLALPFFRNSLLGDAGYIALFVALYSLGSSWAKTYKFTGGVA